MKNFQSRHAAAMEKIWFRARNRKHRNHPRKRPRLLFENCRSRKEAISSQITAQKHILESLYAESVLKLESSLKSANIALKMKDYELKKNGERLRFSSQGKTSAEKENR